MTRDGGQPRHCRSPVCQRGAALITALIFLLIMSILSVSGMHDARLETRMAANSQLQAAALNNAERAISYAAAELKNALAAGKDFNAGGDHFFDSSPGGAESVNPMTPDWSSITAAAVPAAPDSRYVIEYAGCHSRPGNPNACTDPVARCTKGGACAHVYTITAHSDAGRGATRTVQSTLALDTGPAGLRRGSGAMLKPSEPTDAVTNTDSGQPDSSLTGSRGGPLQVGELNGIGLGDDGSGVHSGNAVFNGLRIWTDLLL